jgi:DNA polymerase-3 subunit alpha
LLKKESPNVAVLFYNGKPMGTLKNSDYVHLHNHTQYSLLDGLTKVPALVERIKELGMDSVAMTDHGTMSGVIEFYKAASGAGIKPIIGMEAYVAPRTYTDRDPAKDRQYFHLTMIAMNNTGYQNLMRLSTLANLEGFYYKPRIDHGLIEKYNEGLIILSGCIGSEVGDALRQDQYEQAKKTATWYKKIFGDRYYIELMDHGHPEHTAVWEEQTKVNEKLLQLSEELNIRAVVTCDAHYLLHEDQEAHEILLCVQTGSFLSDEKRFSLKDFHLHVEDPAELIKRWGKTHPELITNTRKIAELCDIEIELGKILIPKFPVPKGMSEKSYLEKLLWQGLAWRYGKISKSASKKLRIDEAKKTLPKEIYDRASYELGIIESMGFNGYFLIVADFINWGKDRGIVFGPGRGSAAGSIIAYALRITEINPLDYDLLFERFLNPDRISMPDIDIDIADVRRGEVIDYCINKYGKERVASIVTFGRMAARNSVRDVARVLQVPYAEADRLAKMIPPPVQGRHIPLAKSLKDNKDLKTENEENEQSARVFDLATKVEGTIRSHGVHAAGVVIAPDDIVNFVPLEVAQKGAIATQYSMGPIEDLGLLKMDFLGLSNLTIIKNTLRIIKKVHGKNIDIDTLPLNDKKTYELLQRGDTTGVFQFESAGMKRYLRDLIPTQFEDIIAMGALYRPGPLSAGLTDSYIHRKNGREKTEYDHPLMKPALQSTFGVLVYQEQFMQISRDVCGFSGGEADTLRKAIGKKKRDVMAKMEKRFIEGAVANGVPKEFIEKFWNQLLGFADYCFNKSHSACYGLISYQTAYLKAHYPAAFMAALMTSDYDDTDRLAIEIAECKKMGIEVLPPDVNQSFHEFAVIPGENKIRFGMDAIKNVGHGAVDEIIRAREKNGNFKSVEEYCREVDCRIVNRKALESLAKAGALDSFEDRSRIVNNIDNILSFSSKLQKNSKSGQVDLFGNAIADNAMALKLNWDDSLAAIPTSEQLIWERELLGLYLSSHPLSDYESILGEKSLPFVEIKPVLDGISVDLGGTISEIREITTKNGSKMAFVKLAGLDGEIELVVFPKLYLEDPEIWKRDNVILTRGKLSSGRDNGRGGDELKMLVDKAQSISLGKAQNYQPKGKLYEISRSKSSSLKITRGSASTTISIKQRLYIRLENSDDQPLLITLKEKLDGYHGDTEVVLVTGPTDSKQIIKLPQTIDVNEESLRDLASIFGALNVVVR